MVDLTKAVLQKEGGASESEFELVFAPEKEFIGDDENEVEEFGPPDEDDMDVFRRLTLEVNSLIEMLIEDDESRLKYSDEIEQLDYTIEEAKEILGIKY